MFYPSFCQHWIYKMKYSCYQDFFVILGWLFTWFLVEKCAAWQKVVANHCFQKYKFLVLSLAGSVRGLRILSGSGLTWWLSWAASRPLIVRSETMIWPSTALKKSFLPQLERKRSKEYLVVLLVVKRKLRVIFLPPVRLEK